MMKQIEEIDGYNKGDWVRFYSGGKLVIGQIEYFWIRAGGFKSVATDQGSTSVDSILEVRKA